MRVLNVSHMADTGGNGIRTKWAFDKLAPDWHYRSTCIGQNWLRYPRDLPWEQALDEWKRADVVHVRDYFVAQKRLGAPDRPTVIHHHGTQLRRKWDQLLPEQRRRGAVGLVSTLDLLAYGDDLIWAPAIYDLDWLAALRRPAGAGVLRIAHAPTNRAVKSTEAFLAAAERLGRELPVEVILIERTPWAECLERKASADIYFDQVALGYGNNAIEAWGMGIPVVAGASDETLDLMVERFGSLPFVLADEGSIYEALRSLAHVDDRERWAKRGRSHALQFHDDRIGVAFLQTVYEDAYDRAAVAA